MKLQFIGAAGTVTGSRYLLEHNNTRVLVDCGLFQGRKELRLRNWDSFPVDPSTIDYLILTHAHIDHSGYIPLLVKKGFSGKILCTEGTLDLCSILLPDSGHIQEEDANRANKFGYSKHKIALPLYTEAEARVALKSFKTLPLGTSYELTDKLKFVFHRAGHILGAVSIKFLFDNRSLVFSGDMGRMEDPVMKAPSRIQYADHLVLESTYGNRLHEAVSSVDILGQLIRKTVSRGGSVLIPSFAVGRAQSILYFIYQLLEKGAIPNLPVYLDSPLAINATNFLSKHSNEHRFSDLLCKQVCDVATYVRTVEESSRLDHQDKPSIIISASGMATGGRVLHHLKHFLGDHRNTVLFTGFQSPGTRGDRLVRGEKEVKIHGEYFSVKSEVTSLPGTSAHADANELIQWLSYFKKAPIRTYLTHGESEAAESLKQKIEDHLGWDVTIPTHLHEVEV